MNLRLSLELLVAATLLIGGTSLGAGCNRDRDGDGDPDETDCEPEDPTIHHGASECPVMPTHPTCGDGLDNDCNGKIDMWIQHTRGGGWYTCHFSGVSDGSGRCSNAAGQSISFKDTEDLKAQTGNEVPDRIARVAGRMSP